MCGEQQRHAGHRCGAEGSPPRVRGTAGEIKLETGTYRITPACAGNSLLVINPRYVQLDHPRVCGEQYHSMDIWVLDKGSPPRVRGTAGVLTGACQLLRITPACAGTSRGGEEIREME